VSLTTEAAQIATANPGITPQQAILRAINKNRDCAKWSLYEPGESPKEHWDEFRMYQLEHDRRKWEKSLERDRRRFDIF